MKINKTFSIDLDLFQKLEKYSKERNIPMSHVIEKSLKTILSHSLEISVQGGSSKENPGQVFDKERGRIGTITIDNNGKRFFNFIYNDKEVFKMVDVTRIWNKEDFKKRMENIINDLLLF
jgi:hypothetical protein